MKKQITMPDEIEKPEKAIQEAVEKEAKDLEKANYKPIVMDWDKKEEPTIGLTLFYLAVAVVVYYLDPLLAIFFIGVLAFINSRHFWK